MAREWKPGDVASVGGMHALYTDGNVGPEWHFADGSVCRAEIVPGVGPLVVIDPEDAEQVERLIALLRKHYETGGANQHVQAALHEFANPTPPKPAEPTGLGAVVRDGAGRIYTRYETASGPTREPQPWWQSANGPEHDVVRRFGWEDIDDVEVLSEGVIV